MTEHEIFEKLKEALDYHYMYDSLECGEERKEVDNLEDYLRIIKQEREIEKDFKDDELNRLNTYNIKFHLFILYPPKRLMLLHLLKAFFCIFEWAILRF